jgi:hypothetical protein
VRSRRVGMKKTRERTAERPEQKAVWLAWQNSASSPRRFFLHLHLFLLDNAVTVSRAISNAMMRSARSVVSENLYSRLSPSAMAPGHANGSFHRDYQRTATRTITSLRRWSVANKELPGWIYSLWLSSFGWLLIVSQPRRR